MGVTGAVRRRSAVADPALRATVARRVPLYYSDGADAALDRPAHVRAGSGLAALGDRLALVQDDANFIAVVDLVRQTARAITLPAGAGAKRQFDDRRGTKRFKLDLEACVAVPDGGHTLLVAFGSGSSPLRESVVVVAGWESDEPVVTVRHAPAFYAALRREAAFAGSELNVEGAVYLGGRIRLFGRGNGARRDGVVPLNATCDVDWPTLRAHLRDPAGAPPQPANVVQYELGALGGIPLGFTDAACWGDRVLFTAAAEDSPDAVRDGRVVGSALGVIDRAGRTRWTVVTDDAGAPFSAKLEGIAVPDDSGGSPGSVYAVADVDDPAAPSELCVVQLRGPWR